jgi:hypothetical protein
MYNESELGEELKRLAKEVKDEMSDEITQAVAGDQTAWLNEQLWASKALREATIVTNDLAKQAYAEAAKKAMKAKVSSFALLASILSNMEDKRDAIEKGCAQDVPLSTYLAELVLKAKDSLEFGVAKDEERILMKRYSPEFVGLKEKDYDKACEGCLASVARHDTKARSMLNAGAPSDVIFKEAARDAYFEGAYAFIGDVIKLNAIAAAFVNRLEDKRKAMAAGSVTDLPTSKYLDEVIPKLRELLKEESTKKEVAVPQKVS